MKIVQGYEAARKILSRQEKSSEIGNENQRKAVEEIIAAVRTDGDAALFRYTEKLDGVKILSLEIEREAIDKAYHAIDKNLRNALEHASRRIGEYHQQQKETLIREQTGQELGWIMRPLQRIGAYVPGGLAPLPSSLIMSVVPARIAGVKEVIVATPPQRDGHVADVVLAAAKIAGADRVFSVGGAQAIAAMALGTATIPAVDKIFGPGNIYVTIAKKQLYGMVGIDGLYGPSEVFIIADETANPAYCAADMLGQAEHGSGASAILVTTSKQLAMDVKNELTEQMKTLKRGDILKNAMERYGVIVTVDAIGQAVELANSYAPEHLCLVCKNAREMVNHVKNAGCLFVGEYAIEVLVDYLAGPNHILPTEGTARFNATLNITDYFKVMSVVNTGKKDMLQLGPDAALIARAEGLDAHARSVEQRLTDMKERENER